jgi:hypothetical protein
VAVINQRMAYITGYVSLGHPAVGADPNLSNALVLTFHVCTY